MDLYNLVHRRRRADRPVDPQRRQPAAVAVRRLRRRLLPAQVAAQRQGARRPERSTDGGANVVQYADVNGTPTSSSGSSTRPAATCGSSTGTATRPWTLWEWSTADGAPDLAVHRPRRRQPAVAAGPGRLRRRQPPARAAAAARSTPRRVLSGSTWTARNGSTTVYTGTRHARRRCRPRSTASPPAAPPSSASSCAAPASMSAGVAALAAQLHHARRVRHDQRDRLRLRRQAPGLLPRHHRRRGPAPQPHRHARCTASSCATSTTSSSARSTCGCPAGSACASTTAATPASGPATSGSTTCTSPGASSHAVETYGVDGITIGTVTARNVGESGLLLNETDQRHGRHGRRGERRRRHRLRGVPDGQPQRPDRQQLPDQHPGRHRPGPRRRPGHLLRLGERRRGHRPGRHRQHRQQRDPDRELLQRDHRRESAARSAAAARSGSPRAPSSPATATSRCGTSR